MNHGYFVLLMLPLGGVPALCSQALAPSGASCVRVQFEPLLSSTGREALDVKLTNGCAKDIVGYSLAIQSNEEPPRVVRRETMVPRLEIPEYWKSPDTDILRAGHTLPISPITDPAGPFRSRLLVVAIVFADGSAAGDPKEIAAVLDLERHALARVRKDSEILAKATEHSDAIAFLYSAEVERSPLIDELRSVLDQGDSRRWAEYLKVKKRRCADVIALYTKHIKALEVNRRVWEVQQ